MLLAGESLEFIVKSVSMENIKSKQSLIRNFSIIAHIDHGKSTLADRLLETTGTVEKRKVKDRMMDTLELEQEKGITIKLQAAKMSWKHNGQDYILNLIDTPGHVDFAYEVSRSLAACEGALLLVDATQGIEAQTVSTIFQALENNLEIIPVINKVDLPNAEIEKTRDELVDMFGFKPEEILLTSGKTGIGVTDLLDAVVERIPAPKGDENARTKALIFDSFYDEHKGVVALVRIFEGNIIKKGVVFPRLRCVGTKTKFDPIEFGYLTPSMNVKDEIYTGEVGYVATGLKDIREVRVGDTIAIDSEYDESYVPLHGYTQPLPMVYASMFPLSNDEYRHFRESLEKLALNDASLSYTPQVSSALGPGFRCGFLGLLHMEIVKERLEREFNSDVLLTVPSVRYEVSLSNKTSIVIEAPLDLPDLSYVEEIREPWADVEIITPSRYIGGIMQLCQDKRGNYKNTEYLSRNSVDEDLSRAIVRYEVPMAELITDFFDKMKSLSQGYASMDYKFKEFRAGDVVKVDILVNNKIIEPMSFLTHKSHAREEGLVVVDKLKDIIPKQQFKIPIQAAIGSTVIAREDISAMRKDVTAKLYGGDITRKMKVLDRQKRGKAKLKKFGNVEIPTEAFLTIMKRG